MDYKQKYKEALERAKELKNKLEKNCSLATPTGIESIFPELAESEDERIRKEIIKHLRLEIETELTLSEDEGKRWIDWLEKQGERYSADPFLNWLEKQGEQKPAWSKEDITNYSKVLFCLQTLTFPTDAERKELITWLKKQCEQNSADSYCQDNCKGFQETGKCFADGECKAKRDSERNNIVEQLTAFTQHLQKRGAFREDLCMDFEHEAQSFIEDSIKKE